MPLKIDMYFVGLRLMEAATTAALLGTLVPKPPIVSAVEPLLCSVDISNNTFNESLNNVLAKMIHEDTTVSIELSHSRISGNLESVPFVLGVDSPKVLESLSARNNILAGGASLFVYPALRRADLSHNKLTHLSDSLPASIEFLDLRSNAVPFHMDAEKFLPIPENLVVHEASDRNPDRRLLCPAMKELAGSKQELLLPADAFHYQGCRCAKGWGDPAEGCQLSPIHVTNSSGRLPVSNKLVFGARGGQSARWLIHPMPMARAVYLNFTHFKRVADGEVRVDVFLGETPRASARVLSYSLENPPPIRQEVLAGNAKGTKDTVLVNFETSSTMANQQLVAFSYRAVESCPAATYTESKQSKRECNFAGRQCSPLTQLQIKDKCIEPSAAAAIQAREVMVQLLKAADGVQLPPDEPRNEEHFRLFLELHPSSKEFLLQW